jgi:hypothetical protein
VDPGFQNNKKKNGVTYKMLEYSATQDGKSGN